MSAPIQEGGANRVVELDEKVTGVDDVLDDPLRKNRLFMQVMAANTDGPLATVAGVFLSASLTPGQNMIHGAARQVIARAPGTASISPEDAEMIQREIQRERGIYISY